MFDSNIAHGVSMKVRRMKSLRDDDATLVDGGVHATVR